MRHFTPHRLRPLKGSGAELGPRTAMNAGLPRAAEANFFISTRTFPARARTAAPSSIFERAGRAHPILAARQGRAAAAGAWSDFNDNAHVDRRAPPGGNSGGGRQREPDRGI